MKQKVSLIFLSVFLGILYSLNSFCGIYVPEEVWPYRNVSVCFSDQSYQDKKDNIVDPDHVWPQEAKVQIEQWVNEEFKPERTGIYFIGFKNCNEDPDADVIVFYITVQNKLDSLLSRIGFNEFSTNSHPNNGERKKGEVVDYQGTSVGGYRPYFFRYSSSVFPKAASSLKFTSDSIAKTVVIHEFGHTSTLMHENDHYDAWSSELYCSYTAQSSEKRSWWSYTPYDKKSIMNYCHLLTGWEFVDRSHYGLSEKDVDLLKSIYANKPLAGKFHQKEEE